MSATTTTGERTTLRTRVQKVGTALSNMVMPNIAAFIAWGLITALFIEVGWLPVPELGGFGTNAAGDPHTGLVGPMITYMLPLMIAHTGGKNVHGMRGSVVGVIATMGVIVGSDVPMFIGAMIMGPLGGWIMKKLDAIWADSIRPGFEMLVNNFSAGIAGGALAVGGFYVVGPLVESFSNAAGTVVETLVNNGLLPLTSLFIEPAKVLFLNNAINHGILTPLGSEQVTEVGQSILFLLEANPGPGLGILAAYMAVGKGLSKASAPGAAIIHFLGGIHEIYFPYILMRPVLIVAAIAGGMTHIFINVLFSTGLVGPAAPGSIFAVIGVTARGSHFGVLLSVAASAAVSFVVAAFLLRVTRDQEGDLESATASMETMKGKQSSVAGALTADAATEAGPINRIVFACDAGMGSSAMGASVLRKKVHGAGHDDIEVVNKAISDLADEWDLVVTHQDLTDRARMTTGSAMHVSVENFMGSPKYDEIVDLINQQRSGDGPAPAAADPAVTSAGPTADGSGTATATAPPDAAPTDTAAGDGEAAGDGDVLTADTIVLSGTATDRAGAITEAGDLLVAAGGVDAGYVAAMHEREESVSTAMGNGLAIPHGTNEAKSLVHRSVMSVVRYDDPIDWGGKQVDWVIGIAGKGDEHLQLLQSIAGVFLGEDKQRLDAATSADDVLAAFADAVE